MKNIIKKFISVLLITCMIIPFIPSIRVNAKIPESIDDSIEVCKDLSLYWFDINDPGEKLTCERSGDQIKFNKSGEEGKKVYFGNFASGWIIDSKFKNIGDMNVTEITDGWDGFKKTLNALSATSRSAGGEEDPKSLSLSNTFGNDFDSIFNEFHGNTSEMENVYAYFRNETRLDYGAAGFIGCDYNRYTSEFIYYVVWANTGLNWTDSSGLLTLVFKSELFIGCFWDGAEGDIKKFFTDNIDEFFKNNGNDLLAEEIVDYSKNSITGLIDRFNGIYKYLSGGYSTSGNLTVNICSNVSLERISRVPILNDGLPDIIINMNSSNSYGQVELVSTNAIQDHEAFGNVEGVGGIWSSLLLVLRDKDHQFFLDMANGPGPYEIGDAGDTTYELIMMILQEAELAVSESFMKDVPDDNTEFDDEFMIMQYVLKLNIQELCEGKTWTNMTRRLNSPIGTIAIKQDGGNYAALSSGSDITLKELFDGLTNYQRSVITQEYNGKLNVLKSGFGIDNIESMRFEFIPKVCDGKDGVVLQLPVLQSEIVDHINNWTQMELDATNSVTCVGRNSYTLAQYILATSLYGVGTDEDNNDLFDLYNADLERMGAAIWDWGGYEDIADAKYFSYMPAEVGAFGDDGYSAFLSYGNQSWDRVVALFFNVEYAFAVMGYTAYGEYLESTPDDIRNFFNGNKTGSNEESKLQAFSWMTSSKGLDAYNDTAITETFSGDTLTLDIFRSIIELHDMCNFLKIEKDNWNGPVKTYLEIYDEHEKFFDALRSNPLIYSRADTGVSTKTEPLGKFFNLDTRTMSDQWNKGFSLSALYVPMETNLYDANCVTFINDSDWISDFYYKYAFYRKAVYINTDSSAIVNKVVTGTNSSGSKVCTLRDLINYDRDIILTVDNNFYNANDVANIISKVDYSAVRQVSGDSTEEVKQQYDSWMDKFGNWASGLFDLDAESILKTGATQYYSQTLAEMVTPLGTEDNSLFGNPYDQYLLSTNEILGDDVNEIRSVLDDYEYSVKQSYGVVSAIYRNADLYNECLLAITTDNAIFKSSIDICKTPGTKEKDWISIYNYYMLANLENQMKNDTSSTLDLDSPIFCDLFGNIVTESGLVIIPAACNATLCGENWDPYTIGWSEYYNNGNRIPAEGLLNDVYTWLLGREYHGATMMAGSEYFGDLQNVSKNKGGGYFSIDNSEVLVLRDTELIQNGLTAVIQFEMPNKNSKIVKQLFYDDAYSSKAKNIWSHTITNLIVEVLRGAPIEYIDYEYEGLSGNMHISKYGVYMAYKLEELMNSLVSGTNGNKLGGNSIVTMPNLAFVTGIEYIVLYVFKIMFALLIVALVVQLYLDATKNSLGVKSVLHFIFTCILLLISFTLVPKLINWSYYKANKDLLADEAGYIMMLNYAKEFEGTEIGVTSITTPETQSELYVQVSDVKPNWWEIIPDVLFGNTFKTVTEMYTKSLEGDALARQEYVQMKGDGLYIDVQDIFNSTNLMYTPSNNVLINYSTAIEGQGATLMSDIDEQDIGDRRLDSDYSTLTVGENDRDSVTSFVMPYYVILDQLVGNINEYNVSRGITAYSWGVGSNGHILTYDVLTPYLTSSEFLEDGYDILGLQWVLNIENPAPIYNPVISDDDELRIQESLWYPTGLTNSMKVSKLNELYDYARDYIADNRHILGKVPDEVFIKVFAMQLATKYNDIFNISQGAAIEIINVDTRDLMRFMVGDKANVYRYYSYSFARYCYEEGGSVGTVFAALLIVIFWMTSFLKPLSMIIILALLVTNVVFRKLLFRKESKCVEGYLIGAACLCGCNYLYALFLKVSMMITDFGLGTITAMVIAFIVQILYVAGLLGIVSIELKDWRNSGFHEWQSIGANITSNMLHAKSVMFDKLLSRSNEAYKEVASQNKYLDRDYDMTVDSMLERDAQREQNALNADD